jgi:hypothetical protein
MSGARHRIMGSRIEREIVQQHLHLGVHLTNQPRQTPVSPVDLNFALRLTASFRSSSTISVTVISGVRFRAASGRAIGANSSSRLASRTSLTSQRKNCRADAVLIVAIPAMGTLKMQIREVQRHRWDSETGDQEHGAARSRP